MLAFMQEQVVNQLGWLTPKEFVDGLALGQMIPGPPLMIAAFVGFKLFGMAGAAVAALAVAGCLAAPPAAVSVFGRAGARLLTFSTTTALVRPWLKAWRTMPCSTPRPLRLRGLLGTLSFFSLFSGVSGIPISILRRFAVFHRAVVPQAGTRRPAHWILADAGGTRHYAGPETVEAHSTRQKRFAFRPSKQGCMYHI